MDIQQQGIVALIRSGLTGEKLRLPDGFDMERAGRQMIRHQIQPLCYVGAVNCGVERNLPAMKLLFQHYCRSLQHSEGQMNAAEQLFRAFDAEGIDYRPLKGCRMKGLYPRAEMRPMGDADVLVCSKQYDRIRSVVEKLGYQEQVESNHELIWNRKDLHLELHKRLIPSYNKDYYRYFGDGWRLAKVEEGTRFGMTCEDEYVYLFTHFAKHYRDGGIGCRHVTDLWVYRKAYPEMNEEYVAAELKKLRLFEFEQNIRRVTAVWFEEADSVSSQTEEQVKKNKLFACFPCQDPIKGSRAETCDQNEP